MALGIDQNAPIFLEKWPWWPLFKEIEDYFTRTAQANALWGADDGAVHQERMGDHRGDDLNIVDRRIEKAQFRSK